MVIGQLGAEILLLPVTIFKTYMTAITSLRKREVIIALRYWLCVTARKNLDVHKWKKVENHWLR